VRVAFFDRSSSDLSETTKGRLFEAMTKRLVEQRLGYVDVILRAKHASLEYDIEGRGAISNALLSGEAKAHDAKIPGSVVAELVGKLVPLSARAPHVDGLLISTSPTTPDADDYLSQFPNGIVNDRITLKSIAGENLTKLLVSSGHMIGDDTIRTRVKSEFGLEAFDTWLVVGTNGDFIAATCGPNLAASPTHYVLLSLDGTTLSVPSEISDRLVSQLPDLAPLTLAVGIGTEPVARPLPQVVPGIGWFDYKFPTAPDHFLGRNETIADVRRFVDSVQAKSTSLRALQVVSRSGVGKSSLLLKLAAELPNAVTVNIDGRSIRTPGDTRLVVTRLVQETNLELGAAISLPRTMDDLTAAFMAVGDEIAGAGRVAVIEIDQFESILSLQPVFQAVLDSVRTVTTLAAPLIWLFARKNDVAVTFDDSVGVDLAGLNAESRSISLADFSPAEGRLMLDRLSIELGEPVRPDLALAISAFAGGFPWLHKRLCAHVLSMRSTGLSQRELVQTGLRAEDLFQEDLASLSEPDKALLRTMAAHLPSTAADLARRLEGEVGAQRLTSKLNEFLNVKLLRLSGDIYDTYNDVFKTYLVTDRIPFQTRFVFRVTPGAAISLLQLIAVVGSGDFNRFHTRVGGNRIALLNKLRELRLLGLIEPTPSFVGLTREAQDAIESNRLGDQLRKGLRSNDLVTRLLDLLSVVDRLTLGDVAQELKRELPHVDVSEKTWHQYSLLLASWMEYAGLARREGDSLMLEEIPIDETLKGRAFSRGVFRTAAFVPSVRPGAVLELLNLLSKGSVAELTLRKDYANSAAGLLRDAAALDLVEVEGGTVSLGPQGRALAAGNLETGLQEIGRLALSKPNVRELFEATAKGPVDEETQKEVLSRYGSTVWSRGTWRWRLGILRAWLIATGLVRTTRSGLIRTNADSR
jgi:hypothetical protein